MKNLKKVWQESKAEQERIIRGMLERYPRQFAPPTKFQKAVALVLGVGVLAVFVCMWLYR